MADLDNDRLLDRFLAAWQSHDADTIAAMFTDDVVFEASFGPDPHGERAVGKAAAKRLAQSIFERIPDVRFEEIRRYVAPDFAALEQVQAGTPQGGTSFEVHIVDLLTLRDGKIAAKRTYRKGRL